MIKIINNVIFRVVNIGIGIDTDRSAASDTQYRVSIGEVFEPKNSQKGGILPISPRLSRQPDPSF
jgi:hypothetical protein